MDCSPPGSFVQGILQARILEWVPMPSSRGSSPAREWTQISYVSCFGRRVFSATWEAQMLRDQAAKISHTQHTHTHTHTHTPTPGYLFLWPVAEPLLGWTNCIFSLLYLSHTLRVNSKILLGKRACICESCHLPVGSSNPQCHLSSSKPFSSELGLLGQ